MNRRLPMALLCLAPLLSPGETPRKNDPDLTRRLALITERMNQLDPKSRELGGLLRLRGGLHFRAGDWKNSGSDFDALAKNFPSVAPQLWERGITLYYLGSYAEGAQQFVDYQTFYNQDVENAVWRYLCQQQVDGKKKAREAMLPIASDRRIPMMEVYALFKGSGSIEAVEQAVGRATPAEAVEARFMGDLYLGLWHHTEGDIPKATFHIDRAVDAYKEGHYMWATAVQHQRLLKQTTSKKKTDD